MQKFEPKQLQRLVDGELDRTAVQSMLKTADANPQHWRELAVGFIEDQMFQQEFNTIEQLESAQRSEAAPVNAPPQQQPFVLNRWIAIAAGILLGLTVGYVVSIVNGPRDNDVQANSVSPDDQGSPDLDGMLADKTPGIDSNPVVSYRPDYHMNLQSPAGDEMLSSEVPLYNEAKARELGYEMNRPVEISGDMARWMKQSGYEMEQKIDYISGKLDDGRQFVIPIRTIRMHAGQ